MALDNGSGKGADAGPGGGVWKSGRGKGRATPKGRQLDETALAELRALLGDALLRRDLLIEYLHLIQDLSLIHI